MSNPNATSAEQKLKEIRKWLRLMKKAARNKEGIPIPLDTFINCILHLTK